MWGSLKHCQTHLRCLASLLHIQRKGMLWFEVTQNPLQNIPITATTGSVLWILYSHNHHACSLTRHFILVSYLSREDNNILEGMYVCTYRTNYYKFPQCTQCTEIILMGGTLPRISHPIGSYKSSKGDTINTGPGPRTGDPRTRGPEDRGPKDPRTWGPGTQGPRFLRAVLHCSC